MRLLPALSLALAVLVLCAAPASAACNSTTTCRHQGDDCTAPSTPNTFLSCAAGSFCSATICQRQPRLGDNCNAVPCFDSKYPGAIGCVSGTCKWANIYLPGESCNTGSDYSNGGCVYGSCGTDKKCTSIGLNGNCSDAPHLCGPGLYCNDNFACVARLAKGSNCTNNADCDYSYVCSAHGSLTAQRTCVDPFTQSATQGCDDVTDCKADLFCTNNHCTAPSPAPSGDCGANPSLCGLTSACDCDAKTKGDTTTEQGSGHCVAFKGLDQDFINQAQSFQRCAKDNKCQDYWALMEANSNALSGFPRGPSQCTDSCSRDLLFDSSVKEGRCSASGGAIALPALIAICAALFAVLML